MRSFPTSSERFGLAYPVYSCSPVLSIILFCSSLFPSIISFNINKRRGKRKSSSIPFSAMRSVAFFPFLVSNAGLGCMICISAYSVHSCSFLHWPFFIFLLGRSCLDSYVSLSFVALLLQHITLWLVSPGLDRSKLFALELFPPLCGSSNSCFCSRLSDCLRSLGRAALLSNGLNHKLLQRNSQLELGWHFRRSFVLFQIALQNPCICFKSIHNLVHLY